MKKKAILTRTILLFLTFWIQLQTFATETTATVSTFTGGDPGEGLDLQGNFVYAVNVGTDGAAGQVGDAFFTGDDVTGVSIDAQYQISKGAWGDVNYGDTANDKNLSTVMDSIRWSYENFGPQTPVTVTLQVETGTEYKLQILEHEGCCSNRGFNILINGVTEVTNLRVDLIQEGDTYPNNPDFTGDFDATANVVGVVITKQFVAASNTLVVVLDGAPANAPGILDRNPILNGFTLERIDVSSPVFNIAAVASPEDGGTVSGGGAFISGSLRDVTARPSSDYFFLNWTEQGNVVSSFPTYQFTLTADRNLVANFIPISRFVSRDLPAGYFEGEALTVTLHANPPAGTSAYGVEETPPSGWTVSDISDPGEFDPVNQKVKWTFLDGESRDLTYSATPPEAANGVQTFRGVANMDGIETTEITGSASIDQLMYHPADTTIPHWNLSLAEVIGYAAAYKRGTIWMAPPNPIELGYVIRGFVLYKGGEDYQLDSTAPAPPAWWIQTPLAPQSDRSQPVPETFAANSFSAFSSGSAVSDLPGQFVPGTSLLVKIQVTPDSGVVAYGVEETPPSGWEISNISDGGEYDEANGKVKWTFLDHTARQLTYEATAPLNAASPALFSGIVNFDGVEQLSISGARSTTLQTETSYLLNISNFQHGTVTKSIDQASYSPGSQVLLVAHPDNGYRFVEWSGDVAGSTPEILVVMDGNKNITASFDLLIQPSITWSNPNDISYGTPLGDGELNATANVPGSFIYSPFSGTMLSAGSDQKLSVLFTPNDAANYSTAFETVSLNVLKAAPMLTWSAPLGISYGTLLSNGQLDASANVPGTFNYSPDIGMLLNVGLNQNLTVMFTPNDTANYSIASKTVAIDVSKGRPIITWAAPADIVYGTPLGAAQLNATANVPGAFHYSPGPATLLNASENQLLMVEFIPSDTSNYDSAEAQTHLNVKLASQTIDFPPLGNKPLSLGSFDLAATASSGLPVKFTVSSDAAMLSGEKTVLLQHLGLVSVKAEQSGNASFLPAEPQTRQFQIISLPVISISSPPDLSTFQFGSPIVISTVATNDDGSAITNVEFFVDSVKVGQIAASPFQFAWDDAPSGNHLLTATATDADGLSSSSPPVHITVLSRNEFVLRTITQTGSSFAIDLAVTPPEKLLAYLIEETIPDGFTASEITGDGVLDLIGQRILWGPFETTEARTLSYLLMPPPGFEGNVSIVGRTFTFDSSASIQGESLISIAPPAISPAKLDAKFVSGFAQLSIAADVGSNCQIQARASLSEGRWETIDTLLIDHTPKVFIDPDSGATQNRFYRVITSYPSF